MILPVYNLINGHYIEIAEATIDDDFAGLLIYRWRRNKAGYVYRRSKGRMIYLHHVVMPELPAAMVRDHINRDKLDNRRLNLRAVTHAINTQNCNARKTTGSGIRGVCWDRTHRLWIARVQGSKGRAIVSKYFKNIDEAEAFVKEQRKRIYPESYED